MVSPKNLAIALAGSVFFAACARLPQPPSPQYAGEENMFRLTGELDPAKIPAGEGRYTHYIPIRIIAINSNGHFYRFSKSEARDIVFSARQAFDKCGIDVRTEKVQSYSAPKEFNTLEQGTEGNIWGTSLEEEKLLSAFHRENEITIYVVRRVDSASGKNSSYSIRDGTTLGYDKRYAGTVYLRHPDLPFVLWHGKYVPAHEMGHILFNEGHPPNADTRNIMSAGRGFSFDVTSEQCRKAKASRFVRKINPPKNKNPTRPKPLPHMKVLRR